MLLICGNIFVDPDEVDAFVEEARATIPAALDNDGCLFISFALNNKADGSMLVLERWRDQASLNTRVSSPEVIELFTKWGSKLKNSLMKYDIMNERSPINI